MDADASSIPIVRSAVDKGTITAVGMDYGTRETSKGVDEVYSIEEAIDAVGFGKFQWVLLFTAGFVWAADAMEIMVISFLLPILKDKWNLVGFWEGSIGSAVFLGIFLGTFFWGAASDRLGRRKGYLAVSLFCSVLGLISSFAPEFWSMIVLRMLVGFGIGGSPVAFSLFSEFLPTSSRGRFLVIFEMFWVVGTLAESGIAWLVLPTIGWRWLLFISALPFVFLLGTYPWIPESPRLLMTQGKVQEAQQILERVAAWNKSALPAGRLVLNTSDTEGVTTATPHKTGLLDLFSPSLRRLTIVLWAVWFSHSIVYYGLILFTPGYFQQIVEANKNSTTIAAPGAAPTTLSVPIFDSAPTNGTNIAPVVNSDISTIDPQVYLLTFITTLGEFPGLVASGILVETRLGRKWLQTIFLFLAGVSLCGLFANPSPWVAIFLMLGGRLFVNGSWAAAWAYTPEAYPTVVRATGLGAANGTSKFASIFSPYVAATFMGMSTAIPVGIFAGWAFLGALLTILLPFDTANRQLADQLDPSSANAKKSSPLLGKKRDSGNLSSASPRGAENVSLISSDDNLERGSLRHRNRTLSGSDDSKDGGEPYVPLDPSDLAQRD